MKTSKKNKTNFIIIHFHFFSFITPLKQTNNIENRIGNIKYHNTDLKHIKHSPNRNHNINSPQDLIHSNANNKFYNYFFNCSYVVDSFSHKYYLNNPKLENYKMERKPIPVSDVKLGFSHDNYLK
jgi:hypothetical protein